MNDFVKYNKVNGVYWLKNPIDTLTVKIKTRPQNGLQLPRFEQYNKSDASIQNLSECSTVETSFKWQEKVFSRHEIEKYSNVHNCITDTELSYFELLENTNREGSKIFTYVNVDYNRPFPIENSREKQSISCLNSCFAKLNLESHDKLGKVFNDGSNSMTRLFRSNEDVSLDSDHWMAMHVVYDGSEYSEESQLLLKQESTLLSLYYNVSKNYLILSPDTNNLTFNPYIVEGDGNGLQYSVEITYEEVDNSEELVKMLNKLHKKWEKKHKQLMNFTNPQLGKKNVFMSFEIVSATDFEVDNMYVEFHIKIPGDIKCTGPLHGKTHTTNSLKTEDLEEWNYGHTVDLEMDISTGIVPSPIKIYLEMISTDWWGRHRTEGYTCLPIPLQPGEHSRILTCMRPEEKNTVEAETRRFFVGGCNLIKDLGVLDNPSRTNYCWRTTGTVRVRWRTLVQSVARGSTVTEGSADAALRRYRRAVATLAAARELYTTETDRTREIVDKAKD